MKNKSKWVIPEGAGKILKRLPKFPGSVALSVVVNVVLLRLMPAEALQAMQGKTIRIRVLDAQTDFDLQYNGKRFMPVLHRPQVDLTISATAQDFYLISQRQVDPDTLFFSRRLSTEGDMELGLVLKNTLDAADLPKWNELLKPSQLWGRFFSASTAK